MKYTKDHEWLRVEGDVVVVGITEHAATQLGDVVFVELPEVETIVAEGDEVAVIESVKAASDILAPVAGEIVEVNEVLVDNPGLVNEDPMGAAWFMKIKIDDTAVLDDFMDEEGSQDPDRTFKIEVDRAAIALGHQASADRLPFRNHRPQTGGDGGGVRFDLHLPAFQSG